MHRPFLVFTFLIAGLSAAPATAQDKTPEKIPHEWLLPKSGSMKQTPIIFVSPRTPAEWSQLRGFWTPTTETAINPITGENEKRPVVKVKMPLGLTEAPPVPLENPLTVERWDLGRKLYFDPILSADATMACASCHSPKKGFTDQSAVSVGIGGQKGGMSAPTVINSAYNPRQFWDGRAASLEEQAQGPVGNPVEMHDAKGGDAWESAVKRLRANPDYVKAFLVAYGTVPTRDAAAKAIASYERTVLSGNSIHDRAEQAMRVRVSDEETGKFVFSAKDYEKVLVEAIKNGDQAALAALKFDPKGDVKIDVLAKKIDDGRALFFGKARCSLCHVGQNFSDGSFHNLGVGIKDGKITLDNLGRFAQLPTGHKNPEFVGAFKTPPLRALPSTGPYMHDGSEKTLEEVVDYYDRGGNANEYLSPKMRDVDAERAYLKSKAIGTKYTGPEVKLFDGTPIVPFQLKLTPQEKASLVLFLRSLEGEVDPLVMDPKMPALR